MFHVRLFESAIVTISFQEEIRIKCTFCALLFGLPYIRYRLGIEKNRNISSSMMVINRAQLLQCRDETKVVTPEHRPTETAVELIHSGASGQLVCLQVCLLLLLPWQCTSRRGATL